MTDKHKGVPSHFGRGRPRAKRAGVPTVFRPGGDGGCLETLQIGAAVFALAMFPIFERKVRSTRIPGTRRSETVRSSGCPIVIARVGAAVFAAVWLTLRAARR